MQYIRHETKAYNLHIIKTDKFKTVNLKLNFKRKFVPEEITKRSLIGQILINTNNTYKTKREFNLRTEELYGLSVYSYNYFSGNYIVSSFGTEFLNEKYTENNMNSSSIDFFLNTILNPNVIEGRFNDEQFELAKRLVKDEIDTIKDDASAYATLRMLKNLNSNGHLGFFAGGNLEDLETVDSKVLYDYYTTMIRSDLIDIFVIGDVEANQIIELFDELFTINTLKKPSQSHIFVHQKIPKRSKTVKEKSNFEQSKLVIGLKTNNLTDFEREYIMRIYAYILGGGPDSKLFKEVREKNSLCYSISASFKATDNVLTISAGISSKDFKKCVSLIKKEILKMNKGDFKEEDISSAVLTYINAFKEIEDVAVGLISSYEAMAYLGYDDIEARISKIKTVKKEDILTVSKKIFMDTVYLLEGGNLDGEENV